MKVRFLNFNLKLKKKKLHVKILVILKKFTPLHKFRTGPKPKSKTDGNIQTEWIKHTFEFRQSHTPLCMHQARSALFRWSSAPWRGVNFSINYYQDFLVFHKN